MPAEPAPKNRYFSSLSLVLLSSAALRSYVQVQFLLCLARRRCRCSTCHGNAEVNCFPTNDLRLLDSYRLSALQLDVSSGILRSKRQIKGFSSA